MNWRFWQKEGGADDTELQKKTAAPRTIPEPVARYMVVDLKRTAEWVWRLMAVERPCQGKKNEFEVRVYEAGKVVASGVKVEDFGSFDNHPELVVLQCCYDRRKGDVFPDEQWDDTVPKAA